MIRASLILAFVFANLLVAQPKGKQQKMMRNLPPRETVRRTLQTNNPGGGKDQRVYFYAKAENNPAAPLILVLHQGGTTAEALVRSSPLPQAPAMRRMAVAFPESIHGKWNDADADFLRQLIETLLKEDPALDRTRVFAMGFNEGGAFAHRLGCTMSGTLAGVASIGGWLLKAQRQTCKPADGLAVFMVDMVEDGELLPNIAETFDHWRTASGCAGDVSVEESTQPVPHKIYLGKNCKDGAEVRHLRATTTTPAWKASVSRELAMFFTRFRRIPKV